MNWKEWNFKRCSVALLLVLGALLAISPAGQVKSHELAPQEIVASILSNSDQVSPDNLADWLIKNRPDLLIVDIRSPEEYQQYHIPGAINIPLSRIFDAESIEMLDDGDRTIVLYSNGERHAAQAWVMLHQYGIHSYVLLGGLNYWAKAILNPEKPDNLAAANSEVLRYQFRKAASAYFSGTAVAPTAETASPAKAKPKIQFKRKKKVDEGC